MNNNAMRKPPQGSAPKSSIPKEFRGFAIQTAKAIREANAKVIAAALEQGKLYKSAKDILKRKGNKEFLVENDFAASMTRKYIQFFETWGGNDVAQLQDVDFLVLLKLCGAKYKEVVQAIKKAAHISQQLIDSLLKELLPPKPKTTPKEVTGWKQGAKGRYYNVVLHDEEARIAIERMAEIENISRQKVIATAIALLQEKRLGEAHASRTQILNFNPVAELERFKQQGKICDYADSDGIWLITLKGGQDLEPVTPQGLPMFLRSIAAA